jgi:prophage maintenance system killer protein
MNELIIYENNQNQIQIAVEFDGDTVWLNLNQISTLFGRDKSVISRHLNGIFKNGELDKKSVVAKNATTASDGKVYQVDFFNLDAIISVGYRINSKQGTHFRQWASKRLKDYLIQGYTINQHRLEQKEQEVQVLKNGIQILSRAIEEKVGDNDWLQEFSNGLKLLDDYDHETLDSKGLSKAKAIYPNMEDYQDLIKAMVSDFDSEVFGKTKDDNFSSSINQITKGMGTEDFYPTLEEKAATLLYLVVKNHSFVDGNKRIAAACFLKFLAANKLLFQANRTPIISNESHTINSI